MYETKRTGISLGTALELIFIVLKLCGLISWKWIWVFSPTWISLIIALLILIFTD